MSSLVFDLRCGWRQLAKTPGFTIVAVLTLALGVGVNTAIFSVVDAVMLKPLPYPHPERLVSFLETEKGRKYFSASLPDLEDFSHNHALEGIVHIGDVQMNLTGSGAPERVPGTRASGNFFDVLGVRPRLGRGFTRHDDRFGAPHVIVLGDEFWRARFGADPDIVGKQIRMDGEPYEVLGVMPPGFVSPEQFTGSDRLEYIIPDCYEPEILTDRGTSLDAAFARLKPGVTIQQARAEIDGIAARLAKAYPSTNKDKIVVIEPAKEKLAAGSRTALLVLLGAVGLILLIACVNVANLLLARAMRQQREIAVRIALGARRSRVMRELLVQTGALALAGCSLGVLMAWWLTQYLVHLVPTGNVPRLGEADLSLPVLLFAFLVCGGAALLFGVAPAWIVSGADPQLALYGSGTRQTAGSGVMRWRSWLMAAEVALSLVLLIGAGLMLKSFVLLRGVGLGFEPDRVVAMDISLPDKNPQSGSTHHDGPGSGAVKPPIDPEALRRFQFFETLTQRVEAIPGVEAAAFGRFPLRGHWISSYERDDKPLQGRDESNEINLDSQMVSVDYFKALRLQLPEGRPFTPDDRVGSEPVIIVNQAFERAFYPGSTAINHRIRRTGGQEDWRRIVGVVADAHYYGQDRQVQPAAFFAAAQVDAYPTAIHEFAVRSAMPLGKLLPAVRQAVWSIDPEQPVTRVRKLSESVSESQSTLRFQMSLLALFASLALLLAVVGIYGVVAYGVEQRTSEIGIRIALGARQSWILGMVVRQSMTFALAGLLAGIAIAWVASRALGGLLYGVKPLDFATYATVSLLLATAVLGAAWLPARRASLIEPIQALRHE
jgi:putative ABC transport system permease protein